MLAKLKNKIKSILQKNIIVHNNYTDNFDYNWDNCNHNTNGELFFINHFADNWDICFDVGANKGEYSSLILKKNPNCKIYCFEPNKNLNIDLKNNGLINIYNYAVGNSDNICEINTNIQDPTQTSFHRTNINTIKEKVQTITIDDFCKNNSIEHISFLKIDTEGHELSVLEGASNMLTDNKIDTIQFEYGGTFLDAGISLKNIYDLLSAKYVIFHLFPTGLLPVKYSKDIEQFKYSNWIAFSKIKL